MTASRSSRSRSWLIVSALVALVLGVAALAYARRDRTVVWDSASGDGYGPAVIWPDGVPQLKGDDSGAWDAVLHWDAVYMAAYNSGDLRVPEFESITAPALVDELERIMSSGSKFPGPSPMIPQSVERVSDTRTLVHACGSIEGPYAVQESVRADLSRHGAAVWTFVLEPSHDGWNVTDSTWNADDGYCSVADAQIGLFDPAPVLPTLREKYGDGAYGEFFGTTPTPQPS